jgi:NAD(P)-dependent dehydrogenase (short-subunit alcohol dehydrogenase family)
MACKSCLRRDEVEREMKNPLDFRGKVALVTGAAAGMGLAKARAFAEAGAAVVLADFKEDAAKAAALTSSDRTLVAAQFALALQGSCQSL